MTPKISVIMPVYNGTKFLKEAVESILFQTFTDFELIIINDGSTDSTEEIVKSFKDSRIIYIANHTNQGLSRSLNTGIEKARGKYIARMDADDLSIKERFARQFSYLEEHPDIDILGSSILTMNENGKKLKVLKRPTTHLEIKFSSLFSTPMYHPTIMGRAEVFKTHRFDESLTNSEDYEIWSRLLFRTKTRFANLTEPLLLYRTFSQSFTQSLNLEKRMVSAQNTINNLGQYLYLNETEKNFVIHLRQELLLSPSEFITGVNTYVKATLNFLKQESCHWRETVRIYFRFIGFIFFLYKHELKKLIRS
jgi:glycosyltransferase involved in cell wall biosynthesis